jgi:tetratricopeptide (TPR) repeat protein
MTHEIRSNALSGVGRFDEAIAAADRAIELNPDSVDAHTCRGNALNGADRFDEATVAAGRAIDLDPDSARAYDVRGTALYSLGRYDEALQAYDRAIELNPDFAAALHHRNIALEALTKKESELVSTDTSYTGGVNWELTTPPQAHDTPAPTTDTTMDTADAPKWPSERWGSSAERGFRKRGALVDYLRSVWKPFIERTNALVTTEILAGVDRPLARAILSYERSQPLPDDIGIVSSKKLKAHSATRPALSRSGLIIPHT